MKRFSFVLVMGLVVGLAVAPAVADQMAMATKHVFVNVDPDVAVGALSGTSVDAGNIQRGQFFVTIPYRVDANKEQVELSVAATPLWKGDIPHPTHPDSVSPIELCEGAGVAINPDYATPLGGASSIASYYGEGDTINGSSSTQFESIVFESSQNGHFSQDVDVVVCWDQNEFEKPEGEYSGWVKLTALLDPSSP